MDDISMKKYIDWNINNVTKLKNKYGFRLKLILEDNSEINQQIGGFSTKKEANQRRNEIITELSNGTYVSNTKILVSDFLIYWLEEIVKKQFTNSTYETYSNAIKKHIIPHVRNLKLYLLNSGHILKIYNKESKISVDEVKLIKTIFNSSLKYAKRKKLIKVIPSKNVKLPKDVFQKKHLKNTLSLEQVKILIENSKDSSIYMQILFAVLMGLRRSEINGLKYSDVDFIHRKLTVQRQLGIKPNTKKEDFAPKTYGKQEIDLKSFSSNRILDIPDYVFEAILEQRKIYEKNKRRRLNSKQYPFQDLGYICCSSYGRPRSKSYNWKPFKEILEKSNLPDIRWHDLRVTYSTLLQKNNFNLKAISKLLGHSKEIITADIYGDTPKIIEDCLEELEPYIDKLIPQETDELKKDFSKDINIEKIIEKSIIYFT